MMLTPPAPAIIAATPPNLSELKHLLVPLKHAGVQIKLNSGDYPMNDTQLADFIGDAPAALIGLDDVTGDVFDRCPNLRLIARNGVGLETVDLNAATHAETLVTAPLGANSTSVAELAIGLMIALVRHVIPTHNRLQGGLWQRDFGMELAGKTLSIIGLGNIGKKVALRAQAFDMTVIAHDIAPDQAFAKQHNIEFVSREEALNQANVLSLHVPLTPETHHMINAYTLEQMRPGAYLINTARGRVISPTAVAQALDNGYLAGAALDVHTVEGAADEELIGRENVITTTHLGAYTRQSVERTAAAAIASLLDFFQGRTPRNAINPDAWRA